MWPADEFRAYPSTSSCNPFRRVRRGRMPPKTSPPRPSPPPVSDGVVGNLAATSGVRESDAVWSKDGQRIAYISDEGGTQALLVRDALALQKPVRHALGNMGYFTLLAWSADRLSRQSSPSVCHRSGHRRGESDRYEPAPTRVRR